MPTVQSAAALLEAARLPFEQARAMPRAGEYMAGLKAPLDKVNAEDRLCTERVFSGLGSALARPGHVSHLERPNYDFMQYIAEKTAGFERSFAPPAG